MAVARVSGTLASPRRCAFSKRTASPALTAAVLAESPLANCVSEREANDQGDSNFQHSDNCAEAKTRTPPRLTGAGSRSPHGYSLKIIEGFFLPSANAQARRRFLTKRPALPVGPPESC